MKLRCKSKKILFPWFTALKAEKQNGGISNLDKLLIPYFRSFFMTGESQNASDLCFKGSKHEYDGRVFSD